LGFYSSDNKFSHNEVTVRYKFIKKELARRGIGLICSGSDGDSRFLKSQKNLVNYGNFQNVCGMTLAGNLNQVRIYGFQDPLHIVKKLNNSLYDTCSVLKMGNFSANLGHLIMVYKKFHKIQHKLILRDLDPADKMNYK
jgi:hypothetical protein